MILKRPLIDIDYFQMIITNLTDGDLNQHTSTICFVRSYSKTTNILTISRTFEAHIKLTNKYDCEMVLT